MRLLSVGLPVVLLGLTALSAPAAAATPTPVPATGHGWHATFQRHDLGFQATPYAVNSRGVIVGQTTRFAFRWDPRTRELTTLGTLGGYASAALGINDRGQIVGWAERADGTPHAFIWEPSTGTMTDLGTAGADSDWSRARAINNAGIIVGSSTSTATGDEHAARWAPGQRHATDLGTLGGDTSIANAVNERGDVVGVSSTARGPWLHAFLWTPCKSDHLTDLGTGTGDASQALDVNNRGQIVGYTFDASSLETRAALWLGPEHRLHRISGLPGPQSRATAINDFGAVTGGYGDVARQHSFVWMPAMDAPSMLPENAGQGFDDPFAILNDFSIYGRPISGPVVWTPRLSW